MALFLATDAEQENPLDARAAAELQMAGYVIVDGGGNSVVLPARDILAGEVVVEEEPRREDEPQVEWSAQQAVKSHDEEPEAVKEEPEVVSSEKPRRKRSK